MADQEKAFVPGTTSSIQRPTGRSQRPDTLDTQIRVSTPENIAFQYEVVGPARRLMAYLADVFFTLTAFGLLTLLTSLVIGLMAGLARGTAFAALLDLVAQFAFTIILVGAFASMWFYGAWMETYYNGQTFGKMLGRIRALSSDGSSIDGSQAVLRNFFRLLDVSPFVPLSMFFGPEFAMVGVPIFAFGLLSMTISPRFQRLGDFVAGTIVVSEEKKWNPGMNEFEDRRVASLARLIPADFTVSPGLARALSVYVDRRQVLHRSRAGEIAAHVASPLVERFGLGVDTNHDLLLCALYYRTFVDDPGEEDNPFAIRSSVGDSAEPAMAIAVPSPVQNPAEDMEAPQ